MSCLCVSIQYVNLVCLEQETIVPDKALSVQPMERV